MNNREVKSSVCFFVRRNRNILLMLTAVWSSSNISDHVIISCVYYYAFISLRHQCLPIPFRPINIETQHRTIRFLLFFLFLSLWAWPSFFLFLLLRLLVCWLILHRMCLQIAVRAAMSFDSALFENWEENDVMTSKNIRQNSFTMKFFQWHDRHFHLPPTNEIRQF